MTTLAYRDKVLAADSAASLGGSHFAEMTKIARHKGQLAGVAGNATFGQAFLNWFEGGESGEPPVAEIGDGSMDRGVIFRGDGIIRVP